MTNICFNEKEVRVVKYNKEDIENTVGFVDYSSSFETVFIWSHLYDQIHDQEKLIWQNFVLQISSIKFPLCWITILCYKSYILFFIHIQVTQHTKYLF